MGDGCDFDQSVGFHQAALNAVAGRLVAGEILGIDGVDRLIVGPVGDEDVVHGHVLHRAAGRLDHRLDEFEHMAGLGAGIADMDDIVVLVEGQGAGDIDDAVGKRARRIGGDRLLGSLWDDDRFWHDVSSSIVLNQASVGAACEMTPQKSLTVETQPKNFSTL